MGDAKYIASVVATYWFVSISMVYLNKVLMSSEGVSISAVRNLDSHKRPHTHTHKAFSSII